MGFEQAHNKDNPRDVGGLMLAPSVYREYLCGEDWWGKSDGSFEGMDSIDDKIDDLDYYMMYIKFGFGRSVRMASRLIQNGHMTRERGLELVRRYDGEFPETYLPDVLDYLGMTRAELMEVVDRHRNPEIWEKSGIIFPEDRTVWKLRNPPL